MMPENYQLTPNADVHHLYHNTMVALDCARELNSALPSHVARLFESASLVEGASIAHIGAGLGYYSAIASHLVGNTGAVLALEIDLSLAQQCASNLSAYKNVTCVHADGSDYPFEPCSLNALIVHGAATHIPRRWLEALAIGGHLLAPLSYSTEEPGQLARITRKHAHFTVEFQHETFSYPCIGAVDDEQADKLREAVETYGWYTNSELRLDPERADESAWLITPSYWISMAEALFLS
jgi:protein-L-isoaspartate(D-aspartate) O-methyltransferase